MKGFLPVFSTNNLVSPHRRIGLLAAGVAITALLFLAFIPRTAAQSLASADPASTDPATATASGIQKSEQLFMREKYDASRRVLEDLLSQYPGDAEILWRLAQHAINDGDGTRDHKARERFFRKAVDYSEEAVQADDRNANAWAYLAAAHGSYAMFAGGKEKVKLANQIRDELEKALALDPQNEVAHTIYGTWHREVSEVGWIERQLANMFLGSMPDGSIEGSIRHLKAAIVAGPNVLRHRFELGLTYISDDREKEAAAAFRGALKCPNGWRTDNRRRAFMKKWLRENG